MIYSLDPVAKRSVGDPATAEKPDDVPLELSTRDEGCPSPLLANTNPPELEVVNDGKFSSPALVLVIPANVETESLH